MVGKHVRFRPLRIDRRIAGAISLQRQLLHSRTDAATWRLSGAAICLAFRDVERRLYNLPLSAYVIGRYSRRWNWRRMLVSLLIGIIVSAVFSWTYTLSDISGVHVQDHQLTTAGKVHAVYMAIALAVFIQFLFFTDRVSVRSICIVSTLLLAHVFIGTHMALGIVKTAYALDWYPAQPLRSVAGWATIGAVAFGLTGETSGFSRIVEIYLYFRGEGLGSTEQYLYFLNDVCAILSLSFVGLFVSRWSARSFLPQFFLSCSV